MRSNLKALAATGAILWGGAVLVVAIANPANPRYGREFLRLVRSISPGYKGKATPAGIAVASAYAVVDGAAIAM